MAIIGLVLVAVIAVTLSIRVTIYIDAVNVTPPH